MVENVNGMFWSEIASLFSQSGQFLNSQLKQHAILFIYFFSFFFLECNSSSPPPLLISQNLGNVKNTMSRGM